MPLFIGLAILAGLVLIFFSLIFLRRAETDPLGDRIEEFAAREEAVPIEEIELSMPISDRIVVPFLRGLGSFVTRFTPQSTLDRTTTQLQMAGSPRNISAAEFWAIRGIVSVLLAGLFLLMMVRFNAAPDRRLLYTLIFAAVGFYLPQLYLGSLISRRRDEIFRKLPDALDLMTICVDAGLTFDGAMAKVDEKWKDALAREFGRVVYEMQLGKTRRQSLRDMTGRMDVPEVASFVASILQADQLGVSIGKVLRIQSEQMRIRRRQRAEEKAQKAPIQMLFPLVFLVFPSMLIVLLGPAAFTLIRNDAVRAIFG